MFLQEGLFKTVSIPADKLFLYYLALLGVLVASYLLGSVNTAIVISRLVYHEDIRTKGSGNAGMTNMLRTYGGKAALMTLFGDLMKTVIAVFLSSIFFGFGYICGVSVGGTGMGECYMAGLFAVLGHIFPVYYKFKGGKGVLVTATMALILSPVPFLLLFLLFVIVVWASRYVSLGSVTVAVLYPIVLSGYMKFLFGAIPGLAALVSVIIACLIVWCHRANLVRIGNRTESKLSFGKKNSDE